MGPIAYALCAVTSLLCFILLLRSFLQNRAPLLLWSSLCFGCLMTQNAILFIDLVLTPQISLEFWRNLFGLAGPTILLFGLIWEKR